MVRTCSPCQAGEHYRCWNLKYIVEQCVCDTCDQIREDALQDLLGEKEKPDES